MINRLRESEWIRGLLQAGLVFTISFGSYLLLAGDLTWTEVAAGTAVAGTVAGFTTVSRQCQARPLFVPLPPARVLAGTLASMAKDTARVGIALVGVSIHGGLGGALSWQAFHPGGKSPRDAGRRALVTLLASLAPNSFVVDLRPSALPDADHALLMHTLATATPLSGKDWPA